jgi:hypothetical protein
LRHCVIASRVEFFISIIDLYVGAWRKLKNGPCVIASKSCKKLVEWARSCKKLVKWARFPGARPSVHTATVFVKTNLIDSIIVQQVRHY